MKSFLFVSLGVLFLCLLGLNIFFKSNVLKGYKLLLNKNMDFTVGQLLNKKKLQGVLNTYPKYTTEIKSLASKLKFSFVFALTIMLVMVLIGVTLLFI